MKRTLPCTVLLARLLAGCAGSRINAQWSDPRFSGQPERGARVCVVCQAVDPTLRRVCAERLAARLVSPGVVPRLDAARQSGLFAL